MNEIDRVRQQLLSRKGQWRQIALESGVAHRAIYNVVYAKNDPRTSTIQALAKWLHDADIADRHHDLVSSRPTADEPEPERPSPNLPQSGNGRRGRNGSAMPSESEPSLAASTHGATARGT